MLSILGQLGDEDIDWLVANGRRRRIATGATLVEEGKPLDSLYVVLEGTLVVTARSAGARELAQLSCGEVVGELSFLDSRPPAATVRAREDSVVLAIPRPALVEKLSEDHLFASRFYRALGSFLAARLRDTVLQLGDRSVTGAEAEERPNEIDPALLDTLELAGARFDWLLRRLRGV